MSHFLFVVGMEYLSHQFELLKQNPNFHYHLKCARMGLTHLCFEDDLMIFCKADIPSVASVLEVLKQFGCTSGLVMNSTKSMLYMGGAREDIKAEIIRSTAMVEGSLPMQYLGIPLHQRVLHIAEYRPLIHNLQKKIDN